MDRAEHGFLTRSRIEDTARRAQRAKVTWMTPLSATSEVTA